MHIGIVIGLFLASYLIQLLLCFKVKNKYIKLIPLYLCLIGGIYSALLYVEFFGLYHDGSWMQLKAYVYFVIITIILTALLLGKVTNMIIQKLKGRRANEKG